MKWYRKESVTDRDQIVSKLLHDGGGLAGLDTGRVVANENGLLRSHGNHALSVVLAVDGAVVCPKHEVLLALQVQAVGLQRAGVVVALCELRDLSCAEHQVLRLCPLRVACSGVNCGPVDLAGGHEVVGVCYASLLVTQHICKILFSHYSPCQDICSIVVLRALNCFVSNAFFGCFVVFLSSFFFFEVFAVG